MRRPCRPDAHGPNVACDQMGLDTDGRGFPHRQVLRGRVATRHCQSCYALCLKEKTALFSVDLPYPVARWQSVLGVFVSPLCPACHDQVTMKHGR